MALHSNYSTPRSAFITASSADRWRGAPGNPARRWSGRATTSLDLTAGWGADSLTLACHGQRVTLLEQNELLFAILEYSLQRLAMEPAGSDCAARMQLEHMEAGEYLRRLDDARGFDCIYLDPMFPLHKSSAKPANML
jgi:16S rRNA G966 N2-methylase RsmD